MRKIVINIPLILGVFSLFCYSFTLAQHEYYKEISRTYEKEIKVNIESSFKKVVLSKGYDDKILVIQHVPDDDEIPDVDIHYKIEKERGYLRIDLSEEGGWEQMKKWVKREYISQGLENNVWYIKINNAIPVKLDIDIGAGSGTIDISGLIVKEFRLNTGASSASVVCNEPNPIVMDLLSIDAGLAKFYGGKLGNANFKTMRFEGGVGSYSLDFSGSLRREATVNVDIGFGTMNIMLPSNIGAQVKYDQGFLSSHSFEDFREVGDGKYVSSNYYDSEGRLTIRIETGLGAVKIKRVNK